MSSSRKYITHVAPFVPKPHPLSSGHTHPIYVLVLLEAVGSVQMIPGAWTLVEVVDGTLVHDRGTCLQYQCNLITDQTTKVISGMLEQLPVSTLPNKV